MFEPLNMSITIHISGYRVVKKQINYIVGRVLLYLVKKMFGLNKVSTILINFHHLKSRHEASKNHIQ
jgi:hypothetical protein